MSPGGGVALNRGADKRPVPAEGGGPITKLSDLRQHEDMVAANMEDLEYRAEWERTRFANEVAMKVIQYRIDHNLTQAELARQLSMRQPHVARLEAGEHEPSLATLRRLAQRLGMSFHIDITPASASELTA